MPARRNVANSCSRNCTGMSRRRASSPIGIGPLPPVRPSSASARSAYGLFVVIEITSGRLPRLAACLAVVGLDDLVGLCVDGGRLVCLDLGREGVAHRVAAAVAVARVLDELLLGGLEALRLAAAGLVDRF